MKGVRSGLFKDKYGYGWGIVLNSHTHITGRGYDSKNLAYQGLYHFVHHHKIKVPKNKGPFWLVVEPNPVPGD